MKLTAIIAAIVVSLAGSACGGNDTAPSIQPGFDVPALLTTDMTVGSGAQATSGRLVTVHYTGWLYNPTAAENKGSQFDSSRGRGQTFAFVLGAGTVIRGWDQGVAGMRIGGIRRLVIPSALGYGSQGSGTSIPPSSALVFEVELINVQ